MSCNLIQIVFCVHVSMFHFRSCISMCYASVQGRSPLLKVKIKRDKVCSSAYIVKMLCHAHLGLFEVRLYMWSELQYILS